jgi:hypothetical protein
VVASAAAEIAGQRVADFGLGRIRMLVQPGFHGHDDAWRAEAALQPVFLVERLLHHRELAVGSKRLDGCNLVALGLNGIEQAGADRRPIEENGAGAANAVLATDVGPGEAAILTQDVGEQPSRLDDDALL